MAGIDWTPQQEQVMNLRDRNILVSAAAGSGKTAVLVERIIREITDKNNPIDIDRLLVVTFTKAAAGEMRKRIGEALEKRLQDNPADEHLQKQLSLLHNAQITTIDSFCQSIIRNYFHVIDLDPVFRVADETEITLMMSDILKELLEEKYEQGQEEFLQFAEIFSPGRTDSAIEELILHLHRIAMSYPWPEEWLDQVAGLYQCQSLEELEKCSWMQELTDYLSQMTDSYLEMAKRARNLCMESDGPEPYLPAIESDIRQLEEIAGSKTYREFAQAFERVNPARLSGKKSDASLEKKEEVKALREEYQKNGIKQLQKRFFFQNPEQMLSDIVKMEPVIRELVEVTRDFMRAFSEKKREEGILDFNDMEHFALNILVDRTEGETRPSQTAKELQEHYQEILTDEYQDSNFIQELILTSISRAPEQRPYLFMVGDVKQSIYQFRLARPELFNDKYNSYTVGQGPYQRIDLHQNFRSRAMVLESANFLFRQLMQECLGGICYDEAASLVVGAKFEEYKGKTAGRTQIMLIERQSDDEEALDKVAMEAAAIGGKIRELVQGDEALYVQQKSEYRRLEYRDIVILLRSPGKWTDSFVEVLTDMGIPAYSETKTGYFSTMEVETVLNLLRIIDNPRQDIPLAAVLRSCLVGLSDEELAGIAAMPRELNYQDGITSFLNSFEKLTQEGEDSLGDCPGKEVLLSWSVEKRRILYEKLSVFWDMLEKYHALSQTLSVYELLQRIYRETGYYSIMSAMPAGQKRAANLDILLQQAVEFAQRGHGGIFAFIRYIESLRKSQIDFGEASLVSENRNVVRIMSIHKSKGLEFPVVFVAGLGKQFNLQDARKSTIIDADYGVGTDFVDLELRVKQPTLIKRMMENRIKQNTLAEEIRILYVALTRAKEMLILTGTALGLEKKLEKWNRKKGLETLSDLTAVSTYLDWIMPVAGSIGAEQYFEVKCIDQQGLVEKESQQLVSDLGQEEMLRNWDTERVYDEELEKALAGQETFRYPYDKEKGIPVKISVSELKRLEMVRAEEMEEWQTETFLDVGTVVEENKTDLSASPVNEKAELVNEEAVPVNEAPRPSFLAGEQEVSGAAKGTLYHLVMEHLPYERILKEKGTGSEGWTGFCQWLEEFSQSGYLTGEEKGLLQEKKFQHFLQSSIGRRMAQAAKDGCLHREQPFMIGLPARQLYPESDSEEMVLVQGIIDAWFTEGDEIVLVDYKTDSVPSGDGQELVKKYQAQLRYYAQALERLTDRRVKERIIYSFALGKEIPL